jgi:predicted nuclease of predicted toxin-antitoxin system
MSRTIRFHLDENVSNSIADSLRRRGIDVTTTPQEGLISAPDDEQLAFAISQERVIFTQDADFLRLNQAGATHTGIAFCRKNTRSIGEIVSGLVLIWECLEPEEMPDRIEFI